MMKSWTLNAQVRTLTGKKAKRLLRQGFVPGVVFGPHRESIPIQVPQQELMKVLHGAGTTHLIDLKLDGKTLKVLIKGLFHEPVSRRLHHVDLFAVDLQEEVTVKIPLSFIGEAPALRKGGILSHSLDHLEVRCLPTHIPETIPVDLSQLTDWDMLIRVADLPVPSEVHVLTDAEAVVAKVEPPKVAVEVEEEAVEEVAKPEEGKEEES